MNVIILITSTTWISLRCRDYSQKLAWILASFVTEKTGWKKWEPKPEVCVARSNKRNCCSATATRKEQIEWAMQSVTVCGPWKKTLASCGQKVKHYSCMNEEWVLCPEGRRKGQLIACPRSCWHGQYFDQKNKESLHGKYRLLDITKTMCNICWINLNKYILTFIVCHLSPRPKSNPCPLAKIPDEAKEKSSIILTSE